MNWAGSMDAIPIFYPTGNYVNQYPMRSGEPYPRRMGEPQAPPFVQYYNGTANPQCANPRMDDFYFRYHTNMNTNFDGVVPR